MNFLTPFFEIIAIAVMINYLLSFFWNTRSMDLLLGSVAFLFAFALSSIFELPILFSIMTKLAQIAPIAALIIFQPELRLALSKLSLKGKKQKQISEFDLFIENLTLSVYHLAEKRTGALILLERETLLSDFAAKGILLEARFSPELLETIFAPGTPLHDGAVIIRNSTLIAAAVVLPLSEESSALTKTLGTRHKAALGITETTDALAIVVSEESGKVSVARDGIMTRGIKADRFKGIIRSLFLSIEDGSDKEAVSKWARA